MPSDINDHNQLPKSITTQATPTNYNTPGGLTSAVNNGSPFSAYIASAVPYLQNQGGGAANFGTQSNVTPGAVAALPSMNVTAAVATSFPPQNATQGTSPGVI
ncbi:MAG TPA: hypothetical protein VMS08_01845, partial [Candidatus Saccharimonadia bacterium]|nr:hypothetical protein [Candidatus Saccharimonadia bacterium]